MRSFVCLALLAFCCNQAQVTGVDEMAHPDQEEQKQPGGNILVSKAEFAKMQEKAVKYDSNKKKWGKLQEEITTLKAGFETIRRQPSFQSVQEQLNTDLSLPQVSSCVASSATQALATCAEGGTRLGEPASSADTKYTRAKYANSRQPLMGEQQGELAQVGWGSSSRRTSPLPPRWCKRVLSDKEKSFPFLQLEKLQKYFVWLYEKLCNENWKSYSLTKVKAQFEQGKPAYAATSVYKGSNLLGDDKAACAIKGGYASVERNDVKRTDGKTTLNIIAYFKMGCTPNENANDSSKWVSRRNLLHCFEAVASWSDYQSCIARQDVAACKRVGGTLKQVSQKGCSRAGFSQQ